MPQIRSQQGSGTAGMLTASAIFVALLVYANQYAFIDSEAQAGAKTAPEETGFTAVAKDAAPKFVAVRAPDIATSDDASTNSSMPVSPTANTGSSVTDTLPQPTAVPLAPAQADHSAASNWYPISTVGYPDDRYASDFNGAGDHRLAAYQYLDNRADGRGRGRGRGTANGDGEFDFSMSFKSRARLAADTDLDGDWSGNGNSAYYGNYYQNTAYQPAYSYGYYRY